MPGELLNRLKAAVQALLRRSEAERELDEELRNHLERQIELNISLGMKPEEARAAARKAFGGVEQAKEQSRDVRGLRWLAEFWQDLCYGMRSLLRNPAFSLTAIAILAIGIGANTAIFSVVYAVILRPLPYADSERLVMIEEDWPAKGIPDIGASLPDFLEWRNNNHVFDRIEAFSTDRYDISSSSVSVSDGTPERVAGVQVSAELFPFLGVAPIQGRRFLSEEQQYGRHRVAILSDSLWRRRFGDRAKLAGQAIKINGEIFTIVGVMPDGFHFPDRDRQIWVPLSWRDRNHTGDISLGVIARLKPGITIAQAQAEMNQIRTRLPLALNGTAEFRERVVPLTEYVVSKELTSILLVLFGAVGFVLLIACANTTNLMLARAVSRQKEMAIRIALGASRNRIIRQALTESLLIGLTGGTLGLLFAISGVGVLQRLGPDLPRFAAVKIDSRVLLFTLALSLVTSMLAGLAPAWQSTKTDLQKSLKDSARTVSGSASSRRLRSALVVTEISLSLVLLICTGLMINSLLRLERVDPGYKTDHILSMRISLPSRLYSNNGAIVDFFKHLEERFSGIPGVELAGYTTSLPLTKAGWMRFFIIEGRPLPRGPAETPLADYRQISAHYFDILGIRMIKGRALNEGDTRNSQPVAVVNESFARQFFPNDEPIGKQFSLVEPENLSRRLTRWTIVGIAKDIKHEWFGSHPKPEIFSLLEQSMGKADDGPENRMSFIVRAAGDPNALVAAVRHEIQALDKELPIEQVATMDQLLSDSLQRQRLIAILLFIFSLIALLLAAAGIYSVMSYSATQRTHEIGIRMALGANRSDALKLIIGQGMRLAFIGIAIGLMSSLALTRFIQALLFEVKASDPLTYAAIALLIVVVSMLACYLPARRAAQVDPLVALRCD